jgi:tetratricopeptide (TPR) repeat protein
LSKLAPIEREKDKKELENDSEIEKKFELIEKFIELSPKIAPTKEAVPVPVNIAKSNEMPSSIMTETLAKIYLEQKKYTKAIQAYEILILKYPEKSSFFADRINDIKILQQNN